jgi:hypothetical protein
MQIGKKTAESSFFATLVAFNRPSFPLGSET